VLRIWINPDDRPVEPTLAPPDLCIEKDLNLVANLKSFAHTNLFSPPCPKHQTESDHDHNSPVNDPLGIAGHVAAWQDVDSLQEKRSSSQDKQYSSDVQKYFHNTFF